MNGNAETLKVYNDHFDRYIEGTVRTRTKKDFQGIWLQDALNEVPADARILEIGSAFGRDATFLKELGYEPELTDATDAAVDYLNENGFVARKLNILTDEIDGTYRTVIACAVFLHFTAEEFIDALKKIHQHLESDGRLMFSVKKGDGEHWSDHKMGVPRYFHYWQPNQIKHMLTETDYAPIDERMTPDQQWLHYVVRKSRS